MPLPDPPSQPFPPPEPGRFPAVRGLGRRRTPPYGGPGDDGSGVDATPTATRLLRIARRNRGLLLVCLVLLPVAAYVVSRLQEKEYVASASLLFRASQADQQIFGNSSLTTSQDPQRAAATNLKLVSLEVVAQRTATAVGNRLTAQDVSQHVQLSPEGASDLISIDATDPDPAFAARLANVFGEEFIGFRRDADRAKIRGAQAVARRRLTQMTPAQRASDQGRQLKRRAQELDILAALQTGNAELAQQATVPDSPSTPKTTRNVALGVVLGLLLGVALTALREQLDRRLKEEDDAVEVFEVPILARVPESRALSRPGEAAHPRDRSAEAEAFGILRANLRYYTPSGLRSILVTSAASRDGKTTVSWNLAQAEARAGGSVLYIEADLRRPTLSTMLEEAHPRGLSQVLAGLADAHDEVVEVDGIDVLFAGPSPPNPASLIESRTMVDVLRDAERLYERVIIDTPPVGLVADAIPLMSLVSGVLIVARLRQTSRDAALRLRDQLQAASVPVLGVVVNGAARKGSDYYGYTPSEPVAEDVVRPAAGGALPDPITDRPVNQL